MSATKTAYKPFSPEERASYRAWLFGSTLDWTTSILREVDYPISELKWFVDGVQALCKGKAMRIAHSTLAKRAQKFLNKSQSKELVKRARELNNEWARNRRYMIFNIETPRPNEREGKDKRARTLYTDYLTPAAVFAQDTEHKVKKSDEVRWKKDSKYRFEKRQEILKAALNMLPNFDRVEDMPPSAQPKEHKPLSVSEYVKQREDILLAENRRILEKVVEGELIDADEIDARLAALEVFHNHAKGELEKSYQSTRDVLIGLKNNRLTRAANMGEIDQENQPAGAEKGNAGIPLIENGEPSIKGNVHIPLSDSPEEVDAEQKKGNADIPLVDEDSPLTQLDCALNYACLGYPVFPVRPDKKPYTEHGFKDATTDQEQVRTWWRKWPDAGIGVPTGKASGWMVLDIDIDKGGDASLSALVEHHGDLPDTLHAKTPRLGDHFVFKNPTDVEVRNSESKIGKGIDIRGEGGYVVVPGCDSSRRWMNTLDPADSPAWIIEAAVSKKHEPVDTDRNVVYHAFNGGRFFSEGERNSGLRNVACGRWIHGYAVDAHDLYQQMLQVRAERCASSRDPNDKSITDEWLFDMVIRTTRNYARGELKGSAA
jgi:hypothetical protein